MADPVKGARLVLVAVAAPGQAPSASLAREVAEHVGSLLGGTMRPSAVLWVPALPVTRSGKVLRGLIRRILAGEEVGSTASVANPEALERLAELAPGRSFSPKK